MDTKYFRDVDIGDLVMFQTRGSIVVGFLADYTSKGATLSNRETRKPNGSIRGVGKFLGRFSGEEIYYIKFLEWGGFTVIRPFARTKEIADRFLEVLPRILSVGDKISLADFYHGIEDILRKEATREEGYAAVDYLSAEGVIRIDPSEKTVKYLRAGYNL